jgi:succinoglycan biosynthesis transport protein ExoP
VYELTSLVSSIRRRRRFAVGLFLVLLVVGAAAVYLMPRSYSTASEVLVKRPDTALQSTAYPQIDALLTWNRDTAMETYVALAHQPAVAERVVRNLGLKTSARDMLAKYVVVTPVTNSDLIKISVDWHDPGDSAAVANEFARAFISQQRTLAASQASEAAASLSIALKKAGADLHRSEAALTTFESQHELADVAGQTTNILNAIGDIQSRERTAEADAAQAQAQLSSIGSQLESAPSTIQASKIVSTDPVADQIQQQLAQQRLQLNVLRQQFTEKYPDVVATEKQIASLESALAALSKSRVTSTTTEPNPFAASLSNQAATLRAQIAGSTAQVSALRDQESALLGRLRVFPGDISELSDLQRREKSAEAIYDAIQSNYFNAVVAQNMAVSDLSIVQYADPAAASVKPPRMLALIIIAIVALFVTLAAVVLVEWTSDSRALAQAR